MSIISTTAYAFANQAVSTTALGLADLTAFSSVDTEAASYAYITVEDQSITMRWDGGTATATAGHVFAAGSTLVLTGLNNLRQLSMIRTGGTDGTVKVTLEK